MTTRKRLILGTVLCLGLIWLGTGGVVVHSYWFNAFSSYDRETRPYILARVEGDVAEYGIPCLFQYYGDKTPLSVTLTYRTHNVVPNGQIAIDKAILRLSTGDVTDLTSRVQAGWVLRPEEHWYLDDAHAQQKKPSLHGELRIEKCIPSRTPFTLRLKGRMISEGVTVESFENDFRFVPQYETQVFTTWVWLIMSGA
jgi:hypothetical protein